MSIIFQILGNHRLSNNECLVSFDIVSLYTNVPVLEAIDVCSDLLYKNRFLEIDKETFKKDLLVYHPVM